MPQRLAGQLIDGGDPVSDEPVFVVDTGPTDESNWSIVATDRSAGDGSWSVTVPNADAERYHAVAQFEESGTLKNALSKPFLTSQPFAQPGLVTVGFDVLTPSTIGLAIPDSEDLQADWDPEKAFDASFNDGETITEDWSEPEGRTADAMVNGDPTYRTDELNGAPAVDFDGSGDYFTTSLNPDTTKPRSVYAVVEWDSTSNDVAYGTFESDNRFYPVYVRSEQIELGYGDNTTLVGSAGSNYHIHTTSFGSGVGEAWVDNTSQGTLSYSGVNAISNTIDIGRRGDGDSTTELDGRIVRILDYQANHDSQTRQDVWDYLNSQYGAF